MVFAHRLHYKRNLLIAIIVSEMLCIAAFLFSPKSSSAGYIFNHTEPIILINSIQPTTQLPVVERIKPTAPAIVIVDITEEPELLDDETITLTSSEEYDTSEDIAKLETGNLSTAPRLTFEVLPDKRDYNISGSLNLFLKIDTDGKVISHQVLYNSIECEKCLDKILSAAYRSKWQPARENGIEVNYWVEKSYVFN